jgi:hypothetical protein
MKLPLANGRYLRPATVIARTLLLSALAVWFFHLYVFLQYDGSRPRVPDVASGRVLEQNNHGHVVYLTVEEQGKLGNIAILAGVLVVTGIAIGTLFAPESIWKKPSRPWEVRRS